MGGTVVVVGRGGAIVHDDDTAGFMFRFVHEADRECGAWTDRTDEEPVDEEGEEKDREGQQEEEENEKDDLLVVVGRQRVGGYASLHRVANR